MFDIESVLLLSSTAILGLFAGAQIAEARLLVPAWKEMSADEFFAYYPAAGPRIHGFFAPLTIAATILPLVAVATGLIRGTQPAILFWILGVSTLAFFSTFFLYFKAANQSFTDRTLTDDELPGELNRWGAWHWARIGFELVAFGCSLVLLLIG
ncbi:MAG: hypothetical protein AAGI08_18270 [Bacteroidota bacterium]